MKCGTEKLTRKELSRYACNDCGVNVVTIGEFYMAKPKVWEGELGLGWDDNLCIGCLEKRLGRTVRLIDDITPAQASSVSEVGVEKFSDRLMDRYGYEKRTSGRWKGRWKQKGAR